MQCKVVIAIVIKKTETEDTKRLTTKEENDVFSPRTTDGGDRPKSSIWSGELIITRQRARFHREVRSDLEYSDMKKAI